MGSTRMAATREGRMTMYSPGFTLGMGTLINSSAVALGMSSELYHFWKS